MKTEINGGTCYVEVSYEAGVPMRITGTGYGDCDPEEPDEFEIIAVYDEWHEPWPELWAEMTQDDEDRIFWEFKRGGIYERIADGR